MPLAPKRPGQERDPDSVTDRERSLEERSHLSRLHRVADRLFRRWDAASPEQRPAARAAYLIADTVYQDAARGTGSQKEERKTR